MKRTFPEGSQQTHLLLLDFQEHLCSSEHLPMCAQSPSAQLASMSHCSALFASTSAWEKLAVKAGHKLLTREKEALVLYHSTALMSFMCAKTPSEPDTLYTHSSTLWAVYSSQGCLCVVFKGYTRAAAAQLSPSSAPQGCPHAEGTALPSCSGLHGTFHPLEYVPCWKGPAPYTTTPLGTNSETLRSSPSCRIELQELT